MPHVITPSWIDQTIGLNRMEYGKKVERKLCEIVVQGRQVEPQQAAASSRGELGSKRDFGEAERWGHTFNGKYSSWSRQLE